MHVALVNVPADAVSVGMVPRVADTLVPRLQVLTSPVGTDSGDHRTFVDIRATVVFTAAFGA